MLDSLERMGGLERQALKICSRLPDYGYEVHVITPGKAGDAARGLLDDRVILHEMGYDPKRRLNVGSYLRGYWLLRRLKPDVFMGSLGANYRGRPAAILAGVPVILSDSGSIRPTASLSVRLRDKLFAGRTDAFICLSKGVAEAEKKRIGRDDIRVEVVCNNIDIEETRRAAQKPAGARHEIGAADDTVVFIAVGRLVWEKAFDILLEAWALLGVEPQQARLVIVGDGPLAEDLRSRARDLDLTDTAHFLGWRENVPSLIKEADALVMSSISEGGPSTLLEAAALGVPCVSSNPQGSNVMLHTADGKTSLVVEAGSAEQLAQAMKKMLDMTPAERQAMGARAYDHVASYFAYGGPYENVAQIDRICRDILAAKGRL